MSATIKCDGCGKEEKMVFYKTGTFGWHKPHDWFQREDKDGPQDACSRECIKKIAEKTGKSAIIAPF